MKVQKIKKLNKQIRPFRNIDKLPAWRYFAILEKGDIRYLLDCIELPLYYDGYAILDNYNHIKEQITKLIDGEEYDSKIEDLKYNRIEENRLVGIKAAFKLLQYDPETSIKWLKYFNVTIKDNSIDSFKKLKAIIRREETRINIEREHERRINKKSNSGNITYIEAVVQAETILKYNIPYNEISTEKWFLIQKEIDKIVKARGKHGEAA